MFVVILLLALVGLHLKAPRGTPGGRYHLKPYWLGDSPVAVRRCARRSLFKRWIDLNCQRCLDGVLVCHWGTMAQNGYRFMVISGKGMRERRRHMTKEELHRPMSKWSEAEAIKARRTDRPGKSYASRVRIYTFREMLKCCKRWRVRPTWELKSRGFADKAIAEKMFSWAAEIKWTSYVMTLVTMKNWQGKMKAFKEAGWGTALLPHGARKTPAIQTSLKTYGKFIDSYWGGWR